MSLKSKSESLRKSRPADGENGEIAFSGQNTFLEMTVAKVKVRSRENEMEDPPYIETYVENLSFFDPFIYSLFSNYCRNNFETSAKVKANTTKISQNIAQLKSCIGNSEL